MGLLDKIFRQDSPAPNSVAATRFQDSGAAPEEQEASRREVRRELVQITLRETMQRHAIPSDWLEVRMLPVVNRKGRSGIHVQLVVRQGQGSLLNYIPSFQSSLMAEIEKIDPRAWEWLLSISWQFAGITSTSGGGMPAPIGSAAPAASQRAAAAPAAGADDDGVAQDLQALFAIRDAALRQAPPAPDFEPTRPGDR